MNGTKSEAHFWTALARPRSAWLDAEQIRAVIASHKVVLGSLIGVGLLVVPWPSEAASAAMGVEIWTAQIVLSLLWAAALVPVYRWRRSETLPQLVATQRALRRYVPDALAAQIERGGELKCGACEVSVLFADICGFTALSQGRGALEIFSIVNPYIRVVAAIVHRYGGYVAEFRGDGLMAIFGAPSALRQKERAAVEAGRAIVEAAAPMRLGARADGTPISVRVGVATGTDYVGDICAGDYVVWSAIGNTTNLAARLQGLTRQFDAGIMIDGRTRAAAGDAANGFQVRPNVPIRGWQGTEDVYLLPLPVETLAMPRWVDTGRGLTPPSDRMG
jgi:class 3 adenylate cyclase